MLFLVHSPHITSLIFIFDWLARKMKIFRNFISFRPFYNSYLYVREKNIKWFSWQNKFMGWTRDHDNDFRDYFLFYLYLIQSFFPHLTILFLFYLDSIVDFFNFRRYEDQWPSVEWFYNDWTKIHGRVEFYPSWESEWHGHVFDIAMKINTLALGWR